MNTARPHAMLSAAYSSLLVLSTIQWILMYYAYTVEINTPGYLFLMVFGCLAFAVLCFVASRILRYISNNESEPFLNMGIGLGIFLILAPMASPIVYGIILLGGGFTS